ncbi:MAG TPA: MauE/DoxX family redox-associated membrane protein [Jatrophihabitantaceae bacterium]
MVVGALSTSAAVLLIVAGVAKIRTPGPASAMIGALLPRVRPGAWTARGAGVIELVVGALALVAGTRVAMAALAACYLVLAAVAIRLAAGPQRVPCGCFGAADGTTGRAQVVLDVACLAVALAGVIRPPGAVTALFDGGALVGVSVLAQALLLAALGYLSVTALPALSALTTEARR